MPDIEIVCEVRLPLLWGATLRLFTDGTVALLTSEDEATLSTADLDGITDLIARARRIRNA